MTETKSIQEYVLKGTNFSNSNVMDNKKIFEDRLETWLHKIDEAGGNLSDEDKETFGNQEQAIQFVEAEQVTNLEDIERELENVSGLVAPLNVLKDWSNNNLSVLEEGEKEAEPEDKELYLSVIRVIQDFKEEVNTFLTEVVELTEQLRRSKELIAVF
jgi:hypothetical protein